MLATGARVACCVCGMVVADVFDCVALTLETLSNVTGASIVVTVKPLAPFASMIRALPSSPNMSTVEGTT